MERASDPQPDGAVVRSALNKIKGAHFPQDLYLVVIDLPPGPMYLMRKKGRKSSCAANPLRSSVSLKSFCNYCSPVITVSIAKSTIGHRAEKDCGKSHEQVLNLSRKSEGSVNVCKLKLLAASSGYRWRLKLHFELSCRSVAVKNKY